MKKVIKLKKLDRNATTVGGAFYIPDERQDYIFDKVRELFHQCELVSETLVALVKESDDGELVIALWTYGHFLGQMVGQCGHCPLLPLLRAKEATERKGN